MPFIACKLPAGLQIEHEGKTLVLVGGNIGEDLENVSRNGSPNDNENRVAGYGLTEVNVEQEATFVSWVNAVTYNDGKKENGKLTHPFAALENHSIVGPFKSKEDAKKECRALAGMVPTGFEGLDEKEEAKKTGITRADPTK